MELFALSSDAIPTLVSPACIHTHIRALCSFVQLPPDIAAQIEPFTPYLSPYLEAIEKEKAELLLSK